LFHELWNNDDARATRLGLDLLAGKHTWIERGITPLPYSTEDPRPRTMDEILSDREQRKSEVTSEEPTAADEIQIAQSR